MYLLPSAFAIITPILYPAVSSSQNRALMFYKQVSVLEDPYIQLVGATILKLHGIIKTFIDDNCVLELL